MRAKSALRKLRSAPALLVLAGGALALVALWLSANWLVQVARKPTELFFPVSGALDKTPAETWRQYEPMFREQSTAVIAPELLAALAQVESAGNPVARTYWRWRLTEDPFDLYRPASSAVGMFQITDGTFREARRYCIHEHVAVAEGAWHEWNSCWFNSLYFRVLPSHAAEMTAAFLDQGTARALDRLKIRNATLRQRQDLAAVMHLCGVAAGEAYARGGFRWSANRRCGDQDVGAYVERVRATQRLFARFAR